MFKRSDGRWCEKINYYGKITYLYAKTERELKKKIKEFEYETDRGEYFGNVAEDWKEEHYKSLTPNSQKPYNGAFNRAMKYFSEERIGDIKREDIQHLIEDMKRAEFAKKTVATQILVLNLIFKYALYHGYLKTNPCDYIETPKNLKKTKREMPSEEDIQKIIDNVESDPFGVFAYFLYFTGCRFGEALALRGEDIDHVEKKIFITKSLYYDNGPKIGKPKTDAGNREIPILDCLADKLPKLKKKQYLFSHLEDRSEPYSQKRIWTQWKKYCERLDLSCTPHQLRHGYATLLFEAGLTAKDAQPLLGHASVEMTNDIYTHITKRRQDLNADKINIFVNETVSKKQSGVK